MSAGVAQLGQGVILDQKGRRGALAVFQHRAEAGGIAHIGVLHFIARRLQHVHDFLAAAEFLVGKFRVSIQVIAEFNRLLPMLFNGGNQLFVHRALLLRRF